MTSQGSATPGVYARLKSDCVAVGFVDLMAIFPGRGCSWYSRASEKCDLFAICQP
jgi:hypothetical protein